MTAYMKWRGLPETVLSLYRGAGAVSGIASTFVFPMLKERIGACLSCSFRGPLFREDLCEVTVHWDSCSARDHDFHNACHS